MSDAAAGQRGRVSRAGACSGVLRGAEGTYCPRKGLALRGTGALAFQSLGGGAALRNHLLCRPDRFANATREVINVTLRTTLAATTKLVMPTPAKPILPVQTGVQAQQEEQSSGMTIFFSLLVLGE